MYSDNIQVVSTRNLRSVISDMCIGWHYHICFLCYLVKFIYFIFFCDATDYGEIKMNEYRRQKCQRAMPQRPYWGGAMTQLEILAQRPLRNSWHRLCVCYDVIDQERNTIALLALTPCRVATSCVTLVRHKGDFIGSLL